MKTTIKEKTTSIEYETLCIDCLKKIARCRFCDDRAKDMGICDRCKTEFNYS